ncbi:MAG TPA: ArsR family transcriptional regulator, partial [Planctomycetota bacterium]|nr:ArsR family transcriptional regulator [Planctomycetota bacterium]
MADYTEAERPRTLDLLKIRGPANIPGLAKLLGVNPNAVRQQLEALHREGLVDVKTARRGVGRPTQMWSLTPKAEALFPQAYGTMAVDLLRRLREIDGATSMSFTCGPNRPREVVAPDGQKKKEPGFCESWCGNPRRKVT